MKASVESRKRERIYVGDGEGQYLIDSCSLLFTDNDIGKRINPSGEDEGKNNHHGI